MSSLTHKHLKQASLFLPERWWFEMTGCVFAWRLNVFFYVWKQPQVCEFSLYASLILTHSLLFFLSFSHAGLQLHPGCHGDSAQHCSGYFVYTLFYLKTALLQESTMLKQLSILLSIRANLLPLSAPRDGGWGPRRALSSVPLLWNHKEDQGTVQKAGLQGRNAVQNLDLSERRQLQTSRLSRSGSSTGERADRTDELFHFKS